MRSGGFIGDLAATGNKESSLKGAGKVRPSVGVMTAFAYNRCSISGGKGKDVFSAFSKGFTVAVGPPHPESDAWIGAFRTASKVVQQAQTITGFTLGDQAPQYWSTGDPVDSKTLGTGKDMKDVALLVVEPSDKEKEPAFWNDLVALHSVLIDDYGWSDKPGSAHEIIVLFADGKKPDFVTDNIDWIDGPATNKSLVDELARVHGDFTNRSLGFFYFAGHGSASAGLVPVPEPSSLTLLCTVYALLLVVSLLGTSWSLCRVVPNPASRRTRRDWA